MFGFISGIILVIVAVVALIVRSRESDSDYRKVAAVVSGIALVIGAVCLTFSMLITVSTKNVGIVTSFGKPVGTLDNGIHAVAPWESVTEFDAAIQTDSHTGTDKESPCTTVRIANSSTACVDNSVRWRIKHESADDLYRDYKDFHNVRDSLVTRELNAALNEVYAAYDPLKVVRDADTAGTPFSHDKLAETVTEKLRTKVGSQIEVLNVIISIVRLDGATEERIKAFQVALADTRIAEQKAKTAAEEAKANAALSGSLSNNPYVLVASCLRTMDKMIEKGQAIPAGFSCWPGNQSNILVQAK